MEIFFKKFRDKHNIQPDYNTQNKSFLKQAEILRRKGIKNYDWMLALYHRDLSGVNPLSDNVTYSQQIKIGIEIKINPVYFFREICKVPGSGGAIPYKLDAGNLIVIWLFFNNINLFYVISRQIGKTVAMLALVLYAMYISYRETDSAMITNTNKLRTTNIGRLKRMRDSVPKWMLKLSSKDSDNKEGLLYHYKETELKTFVGSRDPIAADAKTRGLSVALLVEDEFAYIDSNGVMLKAASSTLSTAGDQAKEQGFPSAHMIFTTAGDLSTKSGKYAHSVVCKCVNWTDDILDMEDEVSLFQYVEDNSSNNMFYITKSYHQLGKDEAWFEKRKKENDLSQEEADKDYKCIWIMGDKNESVINPSILKRLDDFAKDPTYIESYETARMWWYHSKEYLASDTFKRTPLIMGCDGSGLVGQDFTTLVILNAETLEIVGTCKCNISNLLVISEFIYKLLKDYPNMMFIPERNHTGIAILDNLFRFFQMNNKNPYLRIFNSYVDTSNGLSVSDILSLDSPTGKEKSRFGYWTSNKSREMLYNTVLLDSIGTTYDKVYDRRLITELQGIRQKNGRLDHGNGGNDDLVIGYLLALYFVKYAKNTRLYDFPHNRIMRKHIDPSNKYTPAQIENQRSMISRKDTLRQLIEATRSNQMKEIYRRELRYLDYYIDPKMTIPIRNAKDFDKAIEEKKSISAHDMRKILSRLTPLK
ncbi:MAG: hypothetical protein GY804_09410 [Alphaproteobacteria bacterium]|nr:hypothetical protein [Alphaproteobacteria bacterium]